MMTNAMVSVGIFSVFVVGAVVLGLLSLQGRDRVNLAEWSLGGRSLGVVLIFVLMAGETYTSFSYLGAAGWSYDYGMPVFYLVVYLAIGFAAGYVVGPILWQYAHWNQLHNITDIAAHRFDSPWLGATIAVLTTLFLLPYIQLQITGMGVVVSTISYGTIDLSVGYVIAFVVAEAFVLSSGLRGSAWVSILKDSLVIITLLVVFVYVPLHYFGGFAPMIDRLVSETSTVVGVAGTGQGVAGIALVRHNRPSQRHRLHDLSDDSRGLPRGEKSRCSAPKRHDHAFLPGAAVRADSARARSGVRGAGADRLEPRHVRARRRFDAGLVGRHSRCRRGFVLDRAHGRVHAGDWHHVGPFHPRHP